MAIFEMSDLIGLFLFLQFKHISINIDLNCNDGIGLMLATVLTHQWCDTAQLDLEDL